MPDYNVIQAARYIGCDPKTVRRMLKRGDLSAERTSRGWLAISEKEVERARIIWQHEQARFGQTREPLDTKPRDDLDSIRRLEERIVKLERRVAELEQSRPVQPITPYDTSTTTEPQNRLSLPNGTLSARDFAAQLGIKYTVFEGMLRHGIKGEPLEHTKIPIENRPGHHTNWFTPDEQEAARALLRKHGRI